MTARLVTPKSAEAPAGRIDPEALREEFARVRIPVPHGPLRLGNASSTCGRRALGGFLAGKAHLIPQDGDRSLSDRLWSIVNEER